MGPWSVGGERESGRCGLVGARGCGCWGMGSGRGWRRDRCLGRVRSPLLRFEVISR